MNYLVNGYPADSKDALDENCLPKESFVRAYLAHAKMRRILLDKLIQQLATPAENFTE
jgi:hypothetical protein